MSTLDALDAPARQRVRGPHVPPSFAFMALLVFIFTVPWEDAVVLPGMGTLSRVSGIGALAAAVAGSLRHRASTRGPDAGVLTVFAYVAWSVLTYFWTDGAAPELTAVATLLQLLVMVWLVYDQCDTPARLRLALQAYLLGATVTAGLTFWTFGAAADAATRVAPAGFNPNAVAYALALGMPMAAYLAFRQRRWYVAYLPVAWWALILTGSRGGLAAAIVGTAMAFMAEGRGADKRRYAAVVVIGLVVWTGIQVIPDEVVQRYVDAPQEVGEGEFSGRQAFWAAGVEAFSRAPVVGLGLGRSTEGIGEVIGTPRSAHNTWLTVLLEAGVVGFVLLLTAFLVPLERVRLLPRLERRFLVLLCLTLLSATLVRDMENDKPLWLTLALLVSFAATGAHHDERQWVHDPTGHDAQRLVPPR